MPCDAIATARAKMPIVLPGDVILQVATDRIPRSHAATVPSSTTSPTSTAPRAAVSESTTTLQTGAYEVNAVDDALAQSVITILQRAAAFVATRAFAKQGQILKAQRVNNATILSINVCRGRRPRHRPLVTHHPLTLSHS